MGALPCFTEPQIGSAPAQIITENRRLWDWIQGRLEEFPNEAQVILLTDANGHVGTTREYTSDAVQQTVTDTRPGRGPQEYIHVGPDGAEVENGNATLFREFLELSLIHISEPTRPH